MLSRCDLPTTPGYKYYGGRGIKVCDRWRRYENFLSDMGARPPDTSLDRIDNDGNYEPSNCRWATRKQQRRNNRANHAITFNGETLTLAEWAEKAGMPRQRLRTRIVRDGWAIEKAITTPKDRGGGGKGIKQKRPDRYRQD
jgi:hypothetical protein